MTASIRAGLLARLRAAVAGTIDPVALAFDGVTLAFEHGPACRPETGCTRTCPGGMFTAWTPGPDGRLVEVTEHDLREEPSCPVIP
jgi:hypothetical protein